MLNRTVILAAIPNAAALDTGVSLSAEFAVNLGAVSADAWLELDGIVLLHDYLADQSSTFARTMVDLISTDGKPNERQLVLHQHAFAAGLLGRIQQRLFAALAVVKHDPCTTH